MVTDILTILVDIVQRTYPKRIFEAAAPPDAVHVTSSLRINSDDPNQQNQSK